MDSTLLDSNLATCTRLQLIISCLQIFWKSLSADEKARLSMEDQEFLTQLYAKRPSQHIYALDTATKQTWLENCGALLQRLHLCYTPQSSPRYELIERLLLEQYQIEGEGESQRIVLKPGKEISADSLQSPHDCDATYRKKKDETVRGYSVNVTETCTEDLNLIVEVQVAPATTADNVFLQEAIENSEVVLEVGLWTKQKSILSINNLRHAIKLHVFS